jgi:hypothetical protein
MLPPLDTPISLHEVDKLAASVVRLSESPNWLCAWATAILAGQSCGTHLAVMTGPYLDLLLDGTKTIESRFTKRRVAPFDRVAGGDIVFFKQASGPVTGVGLAGEVRNLDLHQISLQEIAATYGSAIAPADPSFWDERTQARYVTLVSMTNVISLPPLAIRKRDRRGWVVLDHPRQQSLF